MSDCFWLSHVQFDRLRPLLPTDTRGRARVDDHRVISGIIHVLQSGCLWKDTPARYGSCKTLHNRFVRWASKGVWEPIFVDLAEADGPPATLMLDAMAHRSAGRKRAIRPKSAALCDLRPMHDAPVDGTIILAKFKDDLSPYCSIGDRRICRWQGCWAPIRHGGRVGRMGYDMGWSIALPVSQRGFVSACFDRWVPLPSTFN